MQRIFAQINIILPYLFRMFNVCLSVNSYYEKMQIWSTLKLKFLHLMRKNMIKRRR